MIERDFKNNWRGVRVVEGARLESVYTSKGYRGFESRPLRQDKLTVSEKTDKIDKLSTTFKYFYNQIKPKS